MDNLQQWALQKGFELFIDGSFLPSKCQIASRGDVRQYARALALLHHAEFIERGKTLIVRKKEDKPENPFVSQNETKQDSIKLQTDTIIDRRGELQRIRIEDTLLEENHKIRRLDYLLIVQRSNNSRVHELGIRIDRVIGTIKKTATSLDAVITAIHQDLELAGSVIHSIPLILYDSVSVSFGIQETLQDLQIEQSGRVIQQTKREILGDNIQMTRRGNMISYRIVLALSGVASLSGQLEAGETYRIYRSLENRENQKGRFWFLPISLYSNRQSESIVISIIAI